MERQVARLGFGARERTIPLHVRFFDTLVRQVAYRRLHTRLNDALLDACAARAGQPSGMGRMSAVDDAMMTDVMEMLGVERGAALLDIGCGRGFAGRFLQRVASGVDYTGCDRAVEALEAARKHVPDGCFIQADFRDRDWAHAYDAVLAIEVTTNGIVDCELADTVARALRPGGRFVVTAASLRAMEVPEPRGFANAAVIDYTQRASAFARGYYGEIVLTKEWHPEIAGSLRYEACAVLEAIDRGTFRYSIVTGTAGTSRHLSIQ